jgi:hypothetical protein
MLGNRWLVMLGGCVLVASAVRADELGYINCQSHPGSTDVLAKAANTPDVVTSLTCGARFKILIDGEIFVKIETNDGKVGYVYSSLVSRDNSATAAQQSASSGQLDASPSVGAADPTKGVPPSPAQLVAKAPNSTSAPTSTASPSAAIPAATPTPAAPATAPSDGKTRVFVTESQSWETRGGSSAGGNKNGWGASSWMAGGARPQTVEIIKTMNQRCPEITVTNNLEKADFVLTLDHEGGKGLLAHRNKIAVFNKDGDDIYSNSTRELGNSVKDACQAMLGAKK